MLLSIVPSKQERTFHFKLMVWIFTIKTVAQSNEVASEKFGIGSGLSMSLIVYQVYAF